MEINIALTCGSTTTFGDGTYSFSLPTGVSVDTTKIALGGSTYRTPLGVAHGLIGSPNLIENATVVLLAGVGVSCHSNGDGAFWSPERPGDWSSGNGFGMRFTVPISGWDVQ